VTSRATSIAIGVAIAALGSTRGDAQPLIDYHQHLVSPAAAGRSTTLGTISAADLIVALDAAHIQRALVLSVAYQFGNPNRPAVENEYSAVKAENDWTSQQVAQYPGRLRAFCAFNPLKDYALDEIARCAKDPNLRTGIKLHFGNSDVDLDNPEHVARVKQVFHAANDRGMAIVVHMHSSVTMKRAYGAKEAAVFLDQLLSEARDIPVQIAHLAGSGGYDDPSTDEALGVFVDAIAKDDPRMRRVYFDASGVVSSALSSGRVTLVASRVRQLGVERVLYGTDAASDPSVPSKMLAAFRRLPLSAAEFKTIEGNVAPYMK
jgi:predicted TIM-barrel fold metal-dependent hydrolase